MNADRALARATVALRRVEEERPDEPLTLLPEAATERLWCWVFPFDTVRAIETGDIMASLATGPLVVPKNNAEPWVAPSSGPIERWLNEYAMAHDLPLVFEPARPDPFAGAA
ncbi:YrhB domain-containing protein [Micromonospora sp. WMMD975]|uniref:YrhB domain-containing protein n=1 Tax=Micromonospora sp. WMMD975 TaxID=3016087 RepID=UPI00249A0E22|nr:YrhB domain-containing protein [Micromonospora sp. WMMD975]WFE34599.1 YrhB domain-containing protein [Micromonospora sp. WMMD975]